ncbi:MAG TPA: O-antigen ligase family protein, partial [Chloroflexota bacterium]|nr:O-antigen ligase family protein [Chloroflexota bacterium]
DPLRLNDTARTFLKVIAAHLLFLPVANLVAMPERAALLVRWFVALAAVEAVVGLALYFAPRSLSFRALSSLGTLGYPTGGQVLRFLPDTDTLRAIGTSIDPNMLGVLLMMAGAIGTAQLLAARPRQSRLVTACLLLPIGACLLLTYSRGSWLGVVGGVLLVGGLKYRRLWLIAPVVGGLALLSPQAERFLGHLGSGLRAQDRASAMRIGEIQNALEIISRYPWFGIGWGTGGQSIELEFTVGVSNIFLAIAERTGVPGLLLYLGIWCVLAVVLWPAVRSRLRDSRDDGLLLGLTAALVAALIAGMVDHHFVSFPHLISLLWSVAALAVVTARPLPEGRTLSLASGLSLSHKGRENLPRPRLSGVLPLPLWERGLGSEGNHQENGSGGEGHRPTSTEVVK